MPLGTLHLVEGTLHIREHRIFLVAHDGGEWELETESKLMRYHECAVVVEGERTGFNRLQVLRIKHDSEEWAARESWFQRFKKWCRLQDSNP
jgi:hypothetical protein